MAVWGRAGGGVRERDRGISESMVSTGQAQPQGAIPSKKNTVISFLSPPQRVGPLWGGGLFRRTEPPPHLTHVIYLCPARLCRRLSVLWGRQTGGFYSPEAAGERPTKATTTQATRALRLKGNKCKSSTIRRSPTPSGDRPVNVTPCGCIAGKAGLQGRACKRRPRPSWRGGSGSKFPRNRKIRSNR